MKAVEGRLGRFQIGNLLRCLFLEVVLCDLINDLFREILLEGALAGDVTGSNVFLP